MEVQLGVVPRARSHTLGAWRHAMLAAVVGLLALGTACLPDDCGDGDTFREVRVEDAVDGSLTVTWSRGDGYGAALQASYFEEAVVDLTGDPSVATLTSATFEAPRTFHLAVDGPREGTSVVSLRLPDRLGYTECTHPGTGDSWFLELALRFEAGKLVSFESSERRSFGPL